MQMKKFRPTIPISEWKIATHLEATGSIQNQSGLPAYACSCKWCSLWKSSFKNILPSWFASELKRILVDIPNPADLYRFETNGKYSSIRIVYFIVGKIQSGPNAWSEGDSGNTLMYRTIQEKPYISLAVYSATHYYGDVPILNDNKAGELICLDMRLMVNNEFQHAHLTNA